MRTEILLSEALGKKLEHYALSYCNEQVILCFEGNVFATLGFNRDKYDDNVDIEQQHLEVFNFGDLALMEADVISSEELELKRDERDAKRDAERLKHMCPTCHRY